MLRNSVLTVIGLLALSSPASALCTSYPYTLTNGTTADGGQVMANFNCAALTSGSTINGLALTGTTTLPGSGTITSAGAVGIQTTSPAAALDVAATFGSFNPTGGSMARLTNSSSTGQSPLDFFINGTLRGRVRADYAGNLNFVANGGNHIFFVGGDSGVGTEAGRFASDGSFLVGTTTNGGWPSGSKAEFRGTGHSLSVYNSASGTGGNPDALLVRVDQTNSWFANFYYTGSQVGTISTNGSSTAYNTTSDARLKDVTIQQKNYRAPIERLWVGDFKWKKGGSAGFGIIAQQAYSEFPQAIQKLEKESDTWQADYSKLAPLALWGVKDLYKLSDSKNARISTLEREISKLRQVNDADQAEIRQLKARISTADDNHAQISRLVIQVGELQRRIGIRAVSNRPTLAERNGR